VQNQYRAIKFVEGSWYYHFIHQDQYFISFVDQIPPYYYGTGQWRESNPQHPHYVPAEASTSAVTLKVQTHNLPRLLEDPRLSPFVSAQTRLSPATVKSESSGEEEEDTHSEGSEGQAATVAPTRTPGTPLDPQQEDVLSGLVQHVLDIKEREPENPLTPEVHAYLDLVQEAIEVGVRVPSPPPLIQPVTPPQLAALWIVQPIPQIIQPVPQIVIMAQQEAAQAQAQAAVQAEGQQAAPAVASRLQGTEPKIIQWRTSQIRRIPRRAQALLGT
jgi:hypothetical protein